MKAFQQFSQTMTRCNRLVDPGDGSLLRTTGVIPKYVVFE